MFKHSTVPIRVTHAVGIQSNENKKRPRTTSDVAMLLCSFSKATQECLSSFDFMTSWRFLKLDYLPTKKQTHPRVPQTAGRPKRGGFVMNILKFNFLEEKPRTAAQNMTSSHWWENAPTQYFWVFTGRDENNYLQTLWRVQMIFRRNASV